MAVQVLIHMPQCSHTFARCASDLHVHSSWLHPCSCSGGLDWVHICRASTKVVTFIDLAGHEKYLKTTIFGMTGHAPDFCMLMVGSNAGIIGMTKGKYMYIVHI